MRYYVEECIIESVVALSYVNRDPKVSVEISCEVWIFSYSGQRFVKRYSRNCTITLPVLLRKLLSPSNPFEWLIRIVFDHSQYVLFGTKILSFHSSSYYPKVFLLFTKNNARITLSGRVKTSIFDHQTRDFLHEKRKRLVSQKKRSHCINHDVIAFDVDNVERMMTTERKQGASSNRCRA